jgi:RNA polymerase sigma-70 factor (ECF subfamily)
MLSIYLAALDTEEERDKFEYYYDKHWKNLVHMAMRITNSQDLAEDAVHNAFCSLIEQSSEILLKEPIDFRRWIVKVVRRKSIDIVRARGTRNAVSIDQDDVPEIASDAMPIDFALTRQEDYDLLRKCIAELDPLNRQILLMKYDDDKSFSKICSELDLTLTQANSRLERVRAKIRKQFERCGQ